MLKYYAKSTDRDHYIKNFQTNVILQAETLNNVLDQIFNQNFEIVFITEGSLKTKRYCTV